MIYIMSKRAWKKSILVFLGLMLFTSLELAFPSANKAQPSSEASYYQTLAQADALYLDQNVEGAEELYRSVKAPFPGEANIDEGVITDPEQLSGAGSVYWREAQRGWDKKIEGATMVPLRKLIEEAPNFLPGHELLIQALGEFGPEEEVLPAIESAVSQFPESVELTRMQAEALAEERQFLEASIAARQFAIVYEGRQDATEFSQLADEYFNKFRRDMNQRLIAAAGTTVFTTAITGQDTISQLLEFAPLLLQGETGIGVQYANQVIASNNIVNDPEIQSYIDSIGQPLADLMGRNDFEYEFFVIENDSLNAFALPGGKIFLNTGSLMAIETEAELAGLLGHEIAHSVLSHGFQSVIEGALLQTISPTLNVQGFFNLLGLQNNRRREQQSDIVGTRAIASAGYAADGLHTFMTRVRAIGNSTPEYLSSHPAPDRRVRYLESLIKQNGYNRYSFEGVERHAAMKQRLQSLLSG